jgi:putative transposase
VNTCNHVYGKARGRGQIGDHIGIGGVRQRCVELAGVEELLAERGLDLSYETIGRWALKFGPFLAQRLRPQPGDRWHADEMVMRIAGRRMYLWRAADQEGEILDLQIQPRRDKRAP